MLLFFKVLFTEFIAEMGDKTQLMLVALTSKYKLRDIILGTAAAILVLNGMAVLAGGLVGSLIPDWIIKIIAALAFMYFAVTSLKKDDDEEEEAKVGKMKFAPLAVFCTFFVAELGDKTQLTAITFGANEGLSSGIIVWLGCSIGLFAADILGMLIGYLLKSKTPDSFLNTLAFIIFAIFGVLTLRQGLMMEGCPISGTYAYPVLISVTVVFAAICILFFLKRRKSEK